jgi:hypothetical protein
MTVRGHQVRPVDDTEVLDLWVVQSIASNPSSGLDFEPEWIIFNEHIIAIRPYIRTTTAYRRTMVRRTLYPSISADSMRFPGSRNMYMLATTHLRRQKAT